VSCLPVERHVVMVRFLAPDAPVRGAPEVGGGVVRQ